VGKRHGALESLVVAKGLANADFWRGKRVFLTGHTGFKGSWLSLWLQSLGAEVTGYALAPNTTPAMFEVAEVAHGMTSIIGDIRDFEALNTAIKAAHPEIVLHLAAQPLVRRSYAEPRETYATNVMGTVNVLDAVRENARENARTTSSVRAIVVATTDKCYENRELGLSHAGYVETDAMGGYDPYSSSKGAAELVTSAYRQSYFHPDSYAEHRVAVASARAGNVIGGGDWSEDRLIPDFIRAITAGEPLKIRNPHATRPWQHVLEPLSGYLTLAENLASNGPRFASAWNFGPADNDARPVDWIAQRLVDLWGAGGKSGAAWQLDGDNHPHEAKYLKLDSTKARTELGWAPKLNLDDALKSLVAWYQAHQTGGADLRELTLQQIRQYETAPQLKK
jgi:CDP-glucose 4,6-dehydratase